MAPFRISAPRLGHGLALVLVVSLQICWLSWPVPLVLKLLTVSMAVLSLVSPASALLVFAVLAPFTTVVADFFGMTPGTPLLEHMVLACCTGPVVRLKGSGIPTRIGWPAAFVGGVAAASAVAMLPALTAPLVWSPHDGLLLLADFVRGRVDRSMALWGPILAALTVIEGALFAWCVERCVRRTPNLAERFILLSLVAQAGSSALGLFTMIQRASRSADFLHNLGLRLTMSRISVQTDINAGASILVMALVAGCGVLTGSVARRTAVGALLVLASAGMWLTGSRTAIICGAAVIGIGVSLLAIQSFTVLRNVFVGVGLVILVATGWLATHYPAGRNDTVGGSVRSRLVLAKAGVHMFSEAPVFGIGLGKFYENSARVVGPNLEAIVGHPRENAHNNFIQILAEEGALGLAAMLLLLGSIVGAALRAERKVADPLRRWLTFGILASVGTWLTGHPMLVPEYSFLFWAFVAVLAALAPLRAPSVGARRVAAVLLVALVASVPLRARALRNAADLEHLGFAVSQWQHDDEQRYREAGSVFALYLPTGTAVRIPIRLAPGVTGPRVVDVTVGGTTLNALTVAGSDWQTLIVVMPKSPRKFDLVDFVVRAADTTASGVLFRVGRTSEL